MSDIGSDRLNQIQAELHSILEERLGALSTALQTTESLTRRIIAADVELERHRLNHAKLKAEEVGLGDQVVEAQEAITNLISTHASLRNEQERLQTEIENKERDVRQLDADVEHARKNIAMLEAEAKSLREENDTLRGKIKTLKENTERMQRLKEELMSSVTGLAQQLRQASGTE